MAEAAPAEPVVIELDDGGSEDNDKDAYATFKAVKVEDKVTEEAA